MLESVHQHRLEAYGSVSTLDLPIHSFAGSGSSGGAPVETLRSSSLGSSPLSFERVAKTAAVIVAFGSTVTFTSDPNLAAALVPQAIVVPGEARSFALASAEARPSAVGQSSIAGIQRELDEAHIEDGVTHGAEKLLVAHLVSYGETGLLDVIHSFKVPARAAAWTRLLGRSASLSAKLRRELVSWGLKNESVEVRDAAIQAVENWEDSSLVALLREHSDQVAWLQDYATNVARDLGA